MFGIALFVKPKEFYFSFRTDMAVQTYAKEILYFSELV